MVRNMAAVDESALVLRAQQGDRPAFAALVDLYWERLYRWLFHLCHERHDAEDIAQESFLKAFSAYPNSREIGSRPGSFELLTINF